jgi:predicted ABC-class ATPase
LEEVLFIKRLRNILIGIDDCNVSYYRKVYEDDSHLLSLKSRPDLQATVLGPYYYYRDIELKFDVTHRILLEKPTITIKIPLKHLKFDDINSYSKLQRLAIEDYCLRSFATYIKRNNTEYYSRAKEAKVTGMLYIHEPGQEIVQRNCSFLTEDNQVCIMIQALLPIYKDREKKLTINGKKAAKMMTKDLPGIIDEFIDNFDRTAVNSWIETTSIQEHLRLFLKESPYCCFVANGSILPRLNGTQLPQENSIPFISPIADEIKIQLNNEKVITGMGIKKGVIVITGGGYSGKSTLLDAIAVGVYNHIPGDGREYVVTDESAVKISAEDGRSIQKVDLSPFIKWLPSSDVSIFSTAHASGSTSQAANIMEAINFGSKLFLIDEDKSATNFMIRDSRMKQLIKKEPITPFTDRVQQLFNETGICTILVIGGSGEYLEIADNVILMDEFEAYNFTREAKAICNNSLQSYIEDNSHPINWYHHRKIIREGFTPYPKEQGSERFDVVEREAILIGDEKLDVRMLHGIISHAQLNALAYMLRFTEVKALEEVIDIQEVVSKVYSEIETKGLDSVFTSVFLTERWLELPRKIELIAAINRMRNIEFI